MWMDEQMNELCVLKSWLLASLIEHTEADNW